MGGPAVDSVDNSPKTPTCPRYPQPYDGGDLISEVLRTLPEDHNKHSLKWYNFWGEPQIDNFDREVLVKANATDLLRKELARKRVTGSRAVIWATHRDRERH